MSGSGDVLKGKAKKTIGDLTGDKDLQREGEIDQATGNIKNRLGQAKHWVEDQLDKATDMIKGH